MYTTHNLKHETPIPVKSKNKQETTKINSKNLRVRQTMRKTVSSTFVVMLMIDEVDESESKR